MSGWVARYADDEDQVPTEELPMLYPATRPVRAQTRPMRAQWQRQAYPPPVPVSATAATTVLRRLVVVK